MERGLKLSPVGTTMRGYFSRGCLMEKKHVVIQALAIACITIIVMVGVLCGHDGTSVYYGIVSIGLIAGVNVYKAVNAKP